MPYDDPDETDPMELAGHAVPAEPGDMERMAEVIVDEYARTGFDRARLVELFRNPFFAMTHAVWQARGDAWCVALVDRVCSRWDRVSARWRRI